MVSSIRLVKIFVTNHLRRYGARTKPTKIGNRIAQGFNLNKESDPRKALKLKILAAAKANICPEIAEKTDTLLGIPNVCAKYANPPICQIFPGIYRQILAERKTVIELMGGIMIWVMSCTISLHIREDTT